MTRQQAKCCYVSGWIVTRQQAKCCYVSGWIVTRRQAKWFYVSGWMMTRWQAEVLLCLRMDGDQDGKLSVFVMVQDGW